MGVLVILKALKFARENPVLHGEDPVNDVYTYLVEGSKDIYSYIVNTLGFFWIWLSQSAIFLKVKTLLNSV